MKKPLLLSLFMTTIAVQAQVICGTAGENATLTLTAPPGHVFTVIEYASYGTPNGSCGSYTNSGCHAVNSQSICETVFLGQNSASIDATNAVFGDPCGGTVKWLTVQARYSTILPLKLLSFTAQKIQEDKVRIAWKSAEEINTSSFIIERSYDGTVFEKIGTVQANGQGSHVYSFISAINAATAPVLYRLRMVDLDGKQQFSNILRIQPATASFSISVYPNPVNDLLTIVSSKQEMLTVYSGNGQQVTSLQLSNGSQTINVAAWSKGLYILKTADSVVRFMKQ